jgi:hypothetical protein
MAIYLEIVKLLWSVPNLATFPALGEFNPYEDPRRRCF